MRWSQFFEVSAKTQGKSIPGRGNSKSKGPEVEIYLACSKTKGKLYGWSTVSREKGERKCDQDTELCRQREQAGFSLTKRKSLGTVVSREGSC